MPDLDDAKAVFSVQTVNDQEDVSDANVHACEVGSCAGLDPETRNKHQLARPSIFAALGRDLALLPLPHAYTLAT